MPKILDACCGSRMFWFDKHNPYTTYMDIRKEYEELPTGHVIDVNPDIIGDFRDMPFPDNEFDLVVFDPPHLKRAGENSWLAKSMADLTSCGHMISIRDLTSVCEFCDQPAH